MAKVKEVKVKEVKEVNALIANDYNKLITAGIDNNLAGLNFINELANKLNNGITQEVAINTLKEGAKDVEISPAVRYSHVPSIVIASLIVKKYENQISSIKVSKVLSLAVRVLADKKAKGALAHIQANESFEDLDTNTAKKKESQTRDLIQEGAEKVSFEAVIDGALEFMKGQNFQTLKTKEPQKVIKLLSQLEQVLINTKQTEKVRA
jgi:hypothetical protein